LECSDRSGTRDLEAETFSVAYLPELAAVGSYRATSRARDHPRNGRRRHQQSPNGLAQPRGSCIAKSRDDGPGDHHTDDHHTDDHRADHHRAGHYSVDRTAGDGTACHRTAGDGSPSDRAPGRRAARSCSAGACADSAAHSNAADPNPFAAPGSVRWMHAGL
jgi:hypothetical protein